MTKDLLNQLTLKLRRNVLPELISCGKDLFEEVFRFGKELLALFVHRQIVNRKPGMENGNVKKSGNKLPHSKVGAVLISRKFLECADSSALLYWMATVASN